MDSLIILVLLETVNCGDTEFSPPKDKASEETEKWFRPIAVYVQSVLLSAILIFVFRICVNFNDTEDSSALSNYQKMSERDDKPHGKWLPAKSDNSSSYQSGLWSLPSAGI